VVGVAAFEVAIGFDALAQDAPTRLVADAIEVDGGTCLVGDRLAGHVETWLGRSRIDGRIGVQVHDWRDRGQGVWFEILREGRGVAERKLEPRSIACSDLSAALGLAIAISIDATLLRTILPEAHENWSRPVMQRAPEAAPASGRAADRSAPVYGMAQAVGMLGVAPVPLLGGAFGAEVGLGEPVGLRLGAIMTVNHSMSLGRGQVDVGLLGGRADGCLTAPVDALSIAACGGISAGRWVARGHGYDVDRTTTIPWAAVVGRLEGRVEVTRRVFVVFSVDGYAPFYRPELDVTDARGDTVNSAQAPAAGMAVGVGPAIEFL